MGTARLGKKREVRGVPVLGKRARRRKGAARMPALPERVEDRENDPAEAGHLIQGMKASDIEWATYTALRSLGWEDGRIKFQVSVMGGRARVGGGQVLDYVIDTGTVPVVLDVRGRQFHGATAGKSSRDRLRELMLLGTSPAMRLVVVWEEVAHNWQRLRSLLLREVGAR